MTISKLKVGAVLAAVAVGWTWLAFAGNGSPLTTPAVAADPPKADAKPADKPKANVVATIGGEDLSRAEFGEYLIRKYGAKEIEGFVNRKIIEQAAAKAKVGVTDAEMDAAMLKDLDGTNLTRKEFIQNVLAPRGFTEPDFREDVIRPRLVLEKLLAGQVKGTEDDARNLFERKYGEKRKVQIAQWSQHVGKERVLALYDQAKRDPAAFDLVNVRGNSPERAIHFDKGPNVYGGDLVKAEVFNLKEPGDVSALIGTNDGWCAVKLVEVIPAAKGKKFEDEKETLLAEATREKLPYEMHLRLTKLREDAKPVYHIQPEAKAYPVPQPAKK